MKVLDEGHFKYASWALIIYPCFHAFVSIENIKVLCRNFYLCWGASVIVIVWWLDLQLHMQAVRIITNVVSWNPAQARYTRYNIMWSICLWIAAGRWFSLSTPISSNNKADHHDITEMLLNMAVKHHNTNV